MYGPTTSTRVTSFNTSDNTCNLQHSSRCLIRFGVSSKTFRLCFRFALGFDGLKRNVHTFFETVRSNLASATTFSTSWSIAARLWRIAFVLPRCARGVCCRTFSGVIMPWTQPVVPRTKANCYRSEKERTAGKLLAEEMAKDNAKKTLKNADELYELSSNSS